MDGWIVGHGIRVIVGMVGANDYLPLRIINPHLAAHQFGEQGVAQGFEGFNLFNEETDDPFLIGDRIWLDRLVRE